MTGPLLRLSGIVKEFPGVRALDGVDLEVQAGEVHCLLGQNGAGKSTLIKVLAGVHRPDAGVLTWAGAPTTFAGPAAATRAGIATIYQELDLVDDLTVAENVFLGHEQRRGGYVLRGQMRRETRTILERLGHDEIPVGRAVGRLTPAARQIVSMARALSHRARLLVMDEPSAVLAQDEVDNLFRVVHGLTEQGIAVVYISHRLDEIREVGDRVTVLKDGRTTARDLPARSTSTAELVRHMTGRTIEYIFPDRSGRAGRAPGADVLTVDGLSRTDEFEDVSLTVHAGEIVGIAGLVGSGRSELLETIFGARRSSSGSVSVDGRRLPVGRVSAAVRAGVGLAPEERKSQALLMQQQIYRNVTLADFPRFATGGVTRAGRERAAASAVCTDLHLSTPDVERPVRTLSGGNQQKVVLGRWLLRTPKETGGTRVLLLDEPTRGVDVGARAELYRLIRSLADDGLAVLMVSSEVPEVLGLADRVLVMREGRLMHEAAAEDLDEARVLDLVMAGSGPTEETS